MKKTFITVIEMFLLVCSSSFSQQIVETKYFSNHNELGGDVIILKQFQRVEGTKSITSFEIKSPRSGRYYISFWLCPPKLNDGTFAGYDVSVNDTGVAGKILPNHGDWQSISLSDGEMIELKKGLNTVSITGMIPDIPSVEHIRVSSTRSNSIIDGCKYDSYKSDIIREIRANLKRNVSSSQTLYVDTLFNDDNNFTQNTSLRDEDPLYDYTYTIGASVKYTFYKRVYFTQNQQVSLITTRLDEVGHILEFFSENSPDIYSWTAVSFTNSGASLNITIPQDGYYYLRVRTYYNAHSGLCNVNINNHLYYDNVPLHNMGVTCTQETIDTLNTFTCHSTNDPILWIQEGGSYGPIIAFNDDYSGSGDFDWEYNSRVRKRYPRPARAALLSAYASYNPTGRCDLYLKCKDGDLHTIFKNLQKDDDIQSSPFTWQYNCISWAGGITSHWVWPADSLSSYSAPDSLSAFDIFFASRGFTRTGATEDNSVIDLWSRYDSVLFKSEYTHASIRKRADSNAHGYDWESKAGALIRAFHPRYALASKYYGEVVEHYIKTTTNNSLLEEEIANGISRIEYVDFDVNERELIHKNLKTINQEKLLIFQRLYDRWKAVTTNTIYSNPNQIADCLEYKELLSYCKTNRVLLYAIYEKLGNGDDISATKLIGDLTFREYPSVMHKIRERVAYKPNIDGKINTIRPLHSNYMAYVKELLALERPDTKKNKNNVNETSGISYSNSTDYDISLSANGLTVEFALDKATNVSLNLVDLAGNVVCSTVNNNALERGNHSFFMKTEKNRFYLVMLILDGHVNVKKIMVK